jgi:hypothetical protein
MSETKKMTALDWVLFRAALRLPPIRNIIKEAPRQ